MEKESNEIFLEINSENGNISLNGMNIVAVNAIDIHMKAGEFTNIVIDMDINGESVKTLINGDVKWFKEIDHKKVCGLF